MTFGQITAGSGHWLIRCEPQVATRLKRVFPRVNQYAKDGNLALSVSPEHARDLLWFMERYPLQVAPGVLDTMRAQARRHEEMESQLSDLLSARRPPDDIQMALPPRDYQRLAATVAKIRGGLLLADDVGLGKSISAMCLMTDPANLPAVVVCPAHMPRQWGRYIERFLPGLKVHMVRKGTPYPLLREAGGRQNDLWPDRLPDVIVLSYHKLKGWWRTLGEFCRYMVLDEVQAVRGGGEIWAAAKCLREKVPLAMGLSATPIYNYGGEFHTIIQTILPDALGDRTEFVREWCSGHYGKEKLDRADEFGVYLRREGIMLRRTRADVARELPGLQKVVHEVESEDVALKEIAGDAAALARVILASSEAYRGERMNASGKFESLVRQATGLAKAPYVADFVRLIAQQGQKVVLFGWHLAVYEIWREVLADLNPVLYTGSESAAQKDAAVHAFTEGAAQVLIMSLRAGAGVDGLQHVCSTVVFGELDWSPGVHEQCVGRVYRDGQDKPVLAYFLTSDDGSDPIMLDVLGVKREQIEGVRNPEQGLIERVDTGTDALRQLAAGYLRGRGEAVDVPSTVSHLHREESEHA